MKKSLVIFFLLTSHLEAARIQVAGSGGSSAISTNTAGAGSFIFNQSTLQSGATFYVSSGTVAGQFKTDTLIATYGEIEKIGGVPPVPLNALYVETEYTGAPDADAIQYAGYFVTESTVTTLLSYGIWGDDQTVTNQGGAGVYGTSVSGAGIYGTGQIGAYGQTVDSSAGIGVYATALRSDSTAARIVQSDPAGLSLDVQGGYSRFSNTGTDYMTLAIGPSGIPVFDSISSTDTEKIILVDPLYVYNGTAGVLHSGNVSMAQFNYANPSANTATINFGINDGIADLSHSLTWATDGIYLSGTNITGASNVLRVRPAYGFELAELAVSSPLYLRFDTSVNDGAIVWVSSANKFDLSNPLYIPSSGTIANFYANTTTVASSGTFGGPLSVGTTTAIGQIYSLSSSTHQLYLGNDSANYLSVFVGTSGRTFFDIQGSTAGFYLRDPLFINVDPASATITSPGLTAPLMFSFAGATGGTATVNAASATGGIGSSATIRTGDGGTVTQSNTRVGGMSGAFSIIIGTGGAVTGSSQTVTGGRGGDFGSYAGFGGLASNSSTNQAVGGRGGDLLDYAGGGGATTVSSAGGTSGAGGNFVGRGGPNGVVSGSGSGASGTNGGAFLFGADGTSNGSSGPSGGKGGNAGQFGGQGSTFNNGAGPTGGDTDSIAGKGGTSGSGSPGTGGTNTGKGGAGGAPSSSGAGGNGGKNIQSGGDGATASGSGNGGNGGENLSKGGNGGLPSGSSNGGNGANNVVAGSLGGIHGTAGGSDGIGGQIVFQLSSGTVFLSTVAVISNNGNWTYTPSTSTTGSPNLQKITGPPHKTLTASTEASDIFWDLNRRVQFATGNLNFQRAVQISSVTYEFVAASLLSTAATVSILGPPGIVAGSTITNSVSFLVQNGTGVFSGGANVAGNMIFQNVPMDTTNYMTVTVSTVGKSTFDMSGSSPAFNFNDSVAISSIGAGIRIAEGTNATMGIATLLAGTVTVNTTKVTASSRIFAFTNGGTLTNLGTEYEDKANRVAGASFIIKSSNILDASDVVWLILEPN